MPRTALYDLNEVLEEAVAIFREHSFHSASMDEIIGRTGFNRRGFYLEFGSKQNFLYQALDFYLENDLIPIVTILDQGKGIESIYAFYQAYVSLVYQEGCLLIDTISELGRQDDKIRDMGRHYVDRLQLSFIGCLEQGQRQGQIKLGIPLESCALQLASLVQGLAINGILAESKDEMNLAIKAVLEPLQT